MDTPAQAESPPAPANTESARRLVLGGALLNLLISTAKFAAGILGHSYALIADGMESALDVASSLVIWGGLKYAAKEPDPDHPYGHGKAEPISALIVSATLTGAAIVLAVLSVQEILRGHRELPAAATLWVLLGVIIVKEVLFRRVVSAGEAISSSAVKTDAWHHRADAITSGAAFVGILVARIGGPNWASADAWAALLACAVIGFNGYRLLIPALGEIMDTAPDPEVEKRVRAAAVTVVGVDGVETCRVRKMGLEFYVDLHVGVDGLMTVAAGHEIAHHVKDAVRAADGRVADVLVHVEPANVCLFPRQRRP